MKVGIAVRLSLLLAVVGVLAAGVTGYSAQKVSSALLISSAKNDLLTSTQVLFSRIKLVRQDVSRDLLVLGTHPAAVAALKANDALQKDHLATLFRLVMEANPGYFQVRLISVSDGGAELVRVDRDGAKLVRVSGDELQEKGHFAYVFDTLKLPPGGTYLSRFVINHERGAHSALNQPTVQLATPVFDPKGGALGVVVINVDLKATFDQLAADLPREFQLFLANRDGDFLIHPDASQTFAFDRGRRVLVQDEFAGTKDLVEGKIDHLFVESSGGRYAKTPVVAAFIARDTQVSSSEKRLVLGLAQPLTSVLAQADELGLVILKIVLVLCLVCIVLAVLVARVVTRPINAMSAAAQLFGNERLSSGLPLERNDEIGLLARSFYRMQNQIKQQLNDLQCSHEKLERLARHDSLTGLPNRTLFAEHMEHALSAVRRDKARLALMFVDIDRFKPVNDTLGHAIGDLLLKEIASRIQNALRESDIAARIGGDEFVVLLRNIQHDDDALTVAEKIRQTVREPISIEGHVITVSASIGIALYPEDGSDIEALSKHADEAMYRAKESGRNAVSFFSDRTGPD